MFEKKVKTLEELQNIIQVEKANGKKVVHCHGCFDIVHYGHLQHFLAAKRQGDLLVVTVTPDIFVKKGLGRPFFNEGVRVNHLAGLECIDYVALNRWESAVECIKMIKPDVFVKGKEVLQNAKVDSMRSDNGIKSNLDFEKEAVESIGGRIFLTDEVTFSSSKIINAMGDLFTEDVKSFLENVKGKLQSSDIIRELDSLKNARILVLGDTILDEYVYCNEMDKSGKEPIVVFSHIESEIHSGGVLAVANHVAQLSSNVTLLTCMGNNSSDFIESSLAQNINKMIFRQEKSKTIKKSRYLHKYRNLKLFEINNAESLELESDTEARILDYLKNNIDGFDVVLVSDFGHGFMTQNLIDFINSCNKFVAINAQLNGSNLGYNFITKYKKADFISLNEKEIRLPFQDRKSDIRVLIRKLSDLMNARHINITLGKRGSVYYANDDFYFAPALNKNPVDTIGSGDAVLAITSLLAYKKLDPLAVSFLANCVGALAVKIVGNRTPIDKIELSKLVSYMLK